MKYCRISALNYLLVLDLVPLDENTPNNEDEEYKSSSNKDKELKKANKNGKDSDKKAKIHSSYQTKQNEKGFFSSQTQEQIREVPFSSSQETPQSSPKITPLRKNFSTSKYETFSVEESKLSYMKFDNETVPTSPIADDTTIIVSAKRQKAISNPQVIINSEYQEIQLNTIDNPIIPERTDDKHEEQQMNEEEEFYEEQHDVIYEINIEEDENDEEVNYHDMIRLNECNDEQNLLYSEEEEEEEDEEEEEEESSQENANTSINWKDLEILFEFLGKEDTEQYISYCNSPQCIQEANALLKSFVNFVKTLKK